MAIGRTDPCHCGSGKRYKNCCRAKDEAAIAASAQAAAPAPSTSAPAEKDAAPPPDAAGDKPFKKGGGLPTAPKPKGPQRQRPFSMRKRAV